MLGRTTRPALVHLYDRLLQHLEVGGEYTMEEVAQHSADDDCWIVVGESVYDVSDFMPVHPGGAGMLQMVAGKDATDFFEELHKPQVLEEVGAQYRIGRLAGADGGGGGSGATGGAAGAGAGGGGGGAAAAGAAAAAEPALTAGAGAGELGASGLPIYSLADVEANALKGWVVLHNRVYDFGPFLERHPGGSRAILRLAGQDATGVRPTKHSGCLLQN